jgi:hypothetical protein
VSPAINVFNRLDTMMTKGTLTLVLQPGELVTLIKK